MATLRRHSKFPKVMRDIPPGVVVTTNAEETPPADEPMTVDEIRDLLNTYRGVRAEPVPDTRSMSIAKVLSWVGGNRDRAQVALVQERDSDSPRVTLVPQLEEILAPPDWFLDPSK